MTILIRDVRLIDPEAGTETRGNLLVQDGRIAAVGPGVAMPEGAAVVEGGGKCLAPGIVDLGVKVGEPGERHKESFRSAGLAAAAGGVTTMVTRPDTTPAIDTPEVLEFAMRRAGEAAPVRAGSPRWSPAPTPPIPSTAPNSWNSWLAAGPRPRRCASRRWPR
jgi:dihydroorotase